MSLRDFFTKNRLSPEAEQKSICGGIIQSTFDSSGFKGISTAQAVQENKGWIFGVTNLIGNNIAQVPLNLYAKTNQGQGQIKNFVTKSIEPHKRLTFQKKLSINADIQQLIDHPASKLLKTVNNYVDGFNLLYLTQVWLDVCGNAYWYVVKDSKGVPVQIHIINPVGMVVVPNSTNTAIQGYYYQSGTDRVSFNVDEIVRFTNASLQSRWYGASPLSQISNNIEKTKQINKLEMAMLKNYGVPPLLLTYKGELTKNQIRDLELQWKRATTNKNAGGAKVLNGDITVNKIAQSISEMMFNEQIIMSLKEVSLAYGVPYSMIDSSDQKKAGLDQILEMMAINCIQPRLARIEQAINQQYTPMFDASGDLFFKFEDPSPSNKLNDSEIYANYVNSGILLKNEVRTMLGFPPLDETEVDQDIGEQ